MKIDPNAPAFPIVHAIIPQPGHFTTTPSAQPGLNIRAEIASRVMAGFAANNMMSSGAADWGPENYAIASVKMANALIVELNKF